jgi:O-antigen/teichoic acid export membrane protein
LDLISSHSFESALIQKKENIRPYLNEVWTFNVLKSLTIFTIIFFAAPLISNFFHLEKAIWAFRLSGIFIVIGGFSNVAQLFFAKEIDFKKIFIRDFSGYLAYATIAIPSAIFFKSFWALFFGTAGQYLAVVSATYALHEFRPRLSFKFARLKELIGYSKWIFGQNMLNDAIPMVENTLVGKMASATGLGLYSKAKSLAFLPLSPLLNIFNKVAFPTYSLIQDSYEKIKDGFSKSLDVIFFLSVPFIVLFVEAGHKIILILFGEKWIGMDTPLKIFVFALTFSILSALMSSLFNAIGKPKIQFYIGAVNLVLLTAFLLLLVPVYGIIGAALGILIISIIILIMAFYEAAKILNIKIADIVKPSLMPLISSLVALAAGRFILVRAEHIGNIAFLALIIFSGAVYAALIILSGKLLKIGPYDTLKLIFSEIFQRILRHKQKPV